MFMSNLHNDTLLSGGKSGLKGFLARVWWLRAGLFFLVCFGILFPFTKTGKDAVRAWKRPQVREIVAKPAPKPEPAPKPKPIPKPVVKRIPTIAVDADTNVRNTLKGFKLTYEAHFTEGEQASIERKRDDSYLANFSLDVTVPTPATTAEQLVGVNPHLSNMLPGLADLMRGAKVSPMYRKLYANKEARLRRDVLNLGSALTNHNFYDCETMLEITYPSTGRQVFLFQADMDVVTDGSDGDRLETMPDEVVNSTHYQPFTSYSWDKVTDKENPMLKGWEQRVRNAEAELALASTTDERKTWLRNRIKNTLQLGIEDMKQHSFLVAEHDPFIVISVDKIIAARRQEHIPGVGDYVAVVYKDKIYPAIVGDGGPTFKAGESSLRLAKEINPIASSYHRPVSTLGVTYIVFPGTAVKPRVAPDYDLWYEQCSMLLEDIGGLGAGYTLHRWEDTFPKPIVPDLEQVLDEEVEDEALIEEEPQP